MNNMSLVEIKRELSSIGINPSEVMSNDTFCRALKNYQLPATDPLKMSIEGLLDLAGDIYYDYPNINNVTGY